MLITTGSAWHSVHIKIFWTGSKKLLTHYIYY